MHNSGQGIRQNGVEVHHQNGVAENATNNAVRISKTMIINDALIWPDYSEKSLWTMAMDHAIHINNHTPHISSVMYTD